MDSSGVDWHHAGSVADLPEGRPTGVRIGTRACVLIRRGDEVFATEPLCPHKFAPLSEGHLEGDCLVCPVHDAHFHLGDGTPRDGDGWAGQLVRYDVDVADGQIRVRFPG